MLKQYFSVLKMCLNCKLYRNMYLIIALGRRNVPSPKLSKIYADICRSCCQRGRDYLFAWRLWTGWWEPERSPMNSISPGLFLCAQVTSGVMGSGRWRETAASLFLSGSPWSFGFDPDQDVCIAAMHDLGSNLQWLEIPMGFSELQNAVGLISE